MMNDELLNLPWSIAPMYAGEPEVLIIDAASEDVVWANRDHAALLVRAVNYSDALVEQIRDLCIALENSDQSRGDRELIRDARELLKKIEAN